MATQRETEIAGEMFAAAQAEGREVTIELVHEINAAALAQGAAEREAKETGRPRRSRSPIRSTRPPLHEVWRVWLHRALRRYR